MRLKDRIPELRHKLKRFLDRLDGKVIILSHVDADGLCSAIVLQRFLERAGIKAEWTYPPKGCNAYSPETAQLLEKYSPDYLFVLDLGSMDQTILEAVPTVLIDHHRPYGVPPGAQLLSSYGLEDTPPTSYITYKLLEEFHEISDLAWLCAVGTAGDIGLDFPFETIPQGGEKLRKKDVREVEVLVNSAKRASAYDVVTAFQVLSSARRISEITRGEIVGVDRLRTYRREVNEEVKRCRHERPYFHWKVALIPFSSKCDIQGLIAETWRRQLKDYIVIAANFGYVTGKVAYVVRTNLEISVIDFMESLKPDDLTQHIVYGHDRAGGGILDLDVWMKITSRMGFKDVRK